MNKFKTLGSLTDEQKQPIWDNKISGSQIKKLMSPTSFIRLYKEKIGELKPIKLSEVPRIQEALISGKRDEAYILKIAKDTQYLSLVKHKVKTDKDTFQSLTYPLRTANIDAYIENDINNIDTIIEIKNTDDMDTKSLHDKYIYQLLYYMWFFNVEKGLFIFKMGAHKLRFLPVHGDDYREETRDMLERILLFEKCLNEKRLPTDEELPPQNPTKHLNVFNLNPEDEKDKVVLDYFNNEAQRKVIVKENKILRKKVEASMDINDCLQDETTGLEIVKELAKAPKRIDYNGAFFHLCDKYGLNGVKLLEQFTTSNQEVPKYRVRKLTKNGK